MKSPNTDAVEILKKRYYKDDPKREAALEEVRANEEVARKIYKLRTDAGLTHKQLAKETGIPVAEIVALEEGDYEGHYLAMLRRIAKRLNKRLELRLVAVKT